jgi:tetratricopeptide (TPR) repeat protein
MKVHVTLLSLFLLISVTSSAQRPRQPDYRYDTLRADPFDLLEIEVANARTNWPNTNAPGQRSTSGSAATVSLQQLQHKVPKPAFKEYKKGRAASNKGDNETALDHFQNAIQMDPEFTDAHNDLGVVLARLGNVGEAAEQFQKALALAPDYNIAVGNLSLAFYLLQRYREALPLARRALKSDSSLLHVRYVLAVSLIAEHGDKKEALENLERAATQFPEARIMASNILAQSGRRAEAAKQLEEYLRSTPKEETNRQEIETRLAQLRN